MAADPSPIERPAEIATNVLAEAAAHPVRSWVLCALSERPGSTIGEVAVRLGQPSRRVRHHIEALLDLGLVAVTSEESRRGVIQRRYGAPPLEIVEDGSWSGDDRLAFSKWTIRALLADVGAAAKSDQFGKSGDDHVIRMYGEVDDRCLEELAAAHDRAYREIRGALEAGRKRVRESGEPGTEVISGILYFQAPLWSEAIESD